MDNKFEKLWWLFILEIALVIYIFLNGGREFIRLNPSNSILIILGLLTFISVFYGFAFEKFNILEDNFLRKMNNLKDVQWEKVKEFYLYKNSEKLLESAQEIQRIDDFTGNVNPKKWLFLATFSFILSLFFFLSKEGTNFPIIKVDLHLIATSLFFIGILLAFFLLNSFVILTISKRNINKDSEIQDGKKKDKKG
jgi:hypothetical protein